VRNRMGSMVGSTETPEPAGRVPPEPVDQGAASLADARERTLLTAYELFRSHGVTAVGVDRIVADAGVAKTTLYRHFRSKEELVLAVLDRHDQVWTQGWLKRLSVDAAETPEAKLLAIFDAFDEWFRQEAYRGCLFANVSVEARGDPGPLGAAASARLRDIREFIASLAAEARIDDPSEFAFRIQILLLGAIIQAVNGDLGAARSAREVAALLLEHAARS
jgi:AcrR family transcriptional regulator